MRQSLREGRQARGNHTAIATKEGNLPILADGVAIAANHRSGAVYLNLVGKKGRGDTLLILDMYSHRLVRCRIVYSQATRVPLGRAEHRGETDMLASKRLRR